MNIKLTGSFAASVMKVSSLRASCECIVWYTNEEQNIFVYIQAVIKSLKTSPMLIDMQNVIHLKN